MKKFLFASLITIFISLILFTPSSAFSGIYFNIYDSLTLQPWGTAEGQSYRIFVSGNGGRILLDTGTLTTPADPVLQFTCNFGDPCPEVGYPNFLTPNSGETVNIYIILTGTTDDPSTITRSFVQPPIPLGTYSISQGTDSGPTAVDLVEFNVTSQTNSSNWLPFILLVSSIALVSGAVTLIRKRRD
jgi:hypothetical protein